MKTPYIKILILILCSAIPILSQELYINELVANNTTFHDNYGETDDWLELFNASSESINLSGYYLSDELDNLAKWQITTDIIIESGEFALFWLDNDIEQGHNHASFKLNKSGETVFLSKEIAGELTIVSALAFPSLPEDISYGRKEDGEATLVSFGQATPASSNNNTLLFSDNTVLFSLPSGAYPLGTTISLSSTNDDSVLYYTTDGTRPDAASSVYNNSILLDSFLYLRVVAYSNNQRVSNIFDAFYFLEGLHDLPIVHLGIEPVNFTGEDWGIHVRGNNGIPGSCDNNGANWHQDWKRNLKFLWLENNEVLEEKATVKIGGACSRNIVMKTLVVDFEEEEGIDFPFFQISDVGKYYELKLRGSGHDFTQTHLRDGALQVALAGKTAIDLMAYRPVVVYINGAYFGVYNAREVMNKDYINTHYGLEPDAFDMIKLPFHETQREIKSGDELAFQELVSFVENNDMADSVHFQVFEEMVDLENMTDYFIAEMFVANFDWPINNMTMWRERKDDGKWRWMLYDLDASSNFGLWSESNPYTNSWEHALKITEAAPEGTTFLAKVLRNESYRAEFLQRLCSFGQLVLSEERVNIITDSLTTILATEMPQHLDFWSGRPDSWGAGTPIGGSLEIWEEKLAWFKDFFRVRFRTFSEILIFRADLVAKFDLKLNFDEDLGGKLVLHQNQTAVPYNYQGEYFKLLPLYLTAIPDEGYEFVYWAETGNRARKLTIKSNENVELTPVFRKKVILGAAEGLELAVFPNPAFRYIDIVYGAEKESRGRLRLVNALGQEIRNEATEISLDLQKKQWSVLDLPRGVYFLIFEDQEKITTKRFVVDQ